MKLTEKSNEVFNYVKENGGRIALTELAEALGRGSRSIGANVTDLQKKGLAVREKETVGEEVVTYCVLTEDGMSFVPSEDED